MEHPEQQGRTGRVFGYARVSTEDQNLDRQIEAIGEVDMLFQEKISGKDMKRPELKRLLDIAWQGDTIKIHSLDRLGRSTRDLLEIIETLTERGVTLVEVKTNTTHLPGAGATDALIFDFRAAISSYERTYSKERQAEGIKLARERGVYKGRAKKLSPKRRAEVVNFVQEKKIPIRRVAEMLGVSRGLIYRCLAEHDEREAEKDTAQTA